MERMGRAQGGGGWQVGGAGVAQDPVDCRALEPQGLGGSISVGPGRPPTFTEIGQQGASSR